MKKLIETLSAKNYGALYVALFGILSYCILVLHFAFVYTDGPVEIIYETKPGTSTNLTLEGERSYVTKNGEIFRYVLNGNALAMMRTDLPLQEGEMVWVSVDILGNPGVKLQIDLFAQDYDNPAQETGIVLDGTELHLETVWNLGENHPENVEFRAFAFASGENAENENLEIRNLQVQVQRRGSILAPVHMFSLILGVTSTILFIISLIIYFTTRDKAEVDIPFAKQGIIYGYLKLKLVPKLKHSSGRIWGNLLVINRGYSVNAPSSGSYPVNIGISIVDENRVMVNQEFGRLVIRTDGILKKGEKVMLPVNLENLQEYSGKNYQLAFTVVQERVAWDRSTAVYYPIP